MFLGAATDVGLVRESNQDCLFIPEESSIPMFIVADGMGGHKAGEIASKLAIDKIKELLYSQKDNLTSILSIEKTIVKSIKDANKDIFKYSIDNEECTGMGTTITMGYVFKNKFVIGHVGDSRAYIIRQGGIAQVTEDHSLVNELLKSGKISEREAKEHPQRNIITRAVGTSDKIDVDIITVTLKKNDIVIICSDGLTNMVKENELLNIFLENLDMQYACDSAVVKAKEYGGNDNITIIGFRL